MINKDEIKKTVLEIIKSKSYTQEGGENEDSFDNLGINSLGFIQIIVDIEEKYDIEFMDSVLIMDDITSVDHLVDLIYDEIEKINK